MKAVSALMLMLLAISLCASEFHSPVSSPQWTVDHKVSKCFDLHEPKGFVHNVYITIVNYNYYVLIPQYNENPQTKIASRNLYAEPTPDGFPVRSFLRLA